MAFLIFLFLCLIFPKIILADSNIEITDYSSATDDSIAEEWIKITNKSENNITLTGWFLKNKNNYDNNEAGMALSGCISPNSFRVFTHSKGWLDDGEGIIYLVDDSNTTRSELAYTVEKKTSSPEDTSTCILPTSTPTPTLTPTSTPIPTNTPTPDPTVTNPSSGIKLTEFMPYSNPEWIEFYNSNNYPVKLVSWKLEDKEGNTRNISSLDIGVTSYAVFEYSPFFDNTNSESVIIRDQNNSAIAQVSYDAGLRTLDRSWVLINDSWCQSSITKSYENVTSCYVNATPTPDSTKYTADEDATASAIIEPKTEASFLSPTSTLQPTPTTTGGLILGDQKPSSDTTNKNYFPLILIISGALLLISPIVINKIKKHKK